MREADIQFKGRDFSVKYSGISPYRMESLVILPVGADSNICEVGVNESRFVIYFPWDRHIHVGVC